MNDQFGGFSGRYDDLNIAFKYYVATDEYVSQIDQFLSEQTQKFAQVAELCASVGADGIQRSNGRVTAFVFSKYPDELKWGRVRMIAGAKYAAVPKQNSSYGRTLCQKMDALRDTHPNQVLEAVGLFDHCVVSHIPDKSTVAVTTCSVEKVLGTVVVIVPTNENVNYNGHRLLKQIFKYEYVQLWADHYRLEHENELLII